MIISDHFQLTQDQLSLKQPDQEYLTEGGLLLSLTAFSGRNLTHDDTLA